MQSRPMQALCRRQHVQDQQQSFLQAYHEVNNSHTWEVCRRECDLCGKGPCGCGGKHCDECQADVQTKLCACGMVRCSNCLHVHIWCDPVVHDNDATAGSPTQPHRGKLLALPSASLQQPAAPSPATVAQPDSCTLCGQAPRKACSCGETRCEQCFLFTGGSLVDTWFLAHPQHQPGT